ncbi:MAG TPA: phage tail protein, partial [Candidatus Nitrosocosmicus sp.]|nr:phage tail protein [Candidatus Nitrosocosmicus sp.]
ADVVWSRENGDPLDKPLGQTWIGSPDALQKWGYDSGKRHRFGFYDGQEEDPGELLLNTYRELLKVKDANETYEINVILLEELTGLAHERVRLGDRTHAINRRIHPSVEVENSIIEYRQNLNDRSLSEVTLGNFRNVYDISSRFERVERDVNEKQGNWDEKATPEDVENATLEMVNVAIEEAQQRINDATIILEQAMEEIEQTKIDIRDAEGLIQDTIDNPQNYKGQMVGDIVADSLIVRGPIISIDATITGRLQSSNATFINATMETGNIINANIQNAVITGRLDSVDGTFVGDLIGARIYSQDTVFVGTKLTVTESIDLGNQNSFSYKYINFSRFTNIAANQDYMTISAFNIQLNGLVTVDGSLDARYGLSVGNTPVSLQGHTHSWGQITSKPNVATFVPANGGASIAFEFSPNGHLNIYRNNIYYKTITL